MEKDSMEEEENNHTSSIVTPVAKSVASHVKIDSISIDLGKAMDKRVTEKCHHFSMRGYVSDMRIKNVRICAPFSRDEDDETKLREQLVPLHVPKFRWWCCQSCVQDATASCSSASQSHKYIERTSPSSVRGEIHPSPSSNKEKDDALVGPSSVHGPENGVNFFSNQQICDQTISFANPERRIDDTVGEESIGRELANVCVPEPASDVAASDVLAIEYPGCKSTSSGEMCLAEKATIDEDLMTVVANETSNKDIAIDASTSVENAGAVKKASFTRRKKKVRLLAEILHVNAEERSDQLASYNATPNECAAPALISASRKRKITQEPSKVMQLPSSKHKKVRASGGDAKTTVATIHNSDSDSVEDDASAGTSFRSHMSMQKTGNEPCSSKSKTKMSHGEERQGSYKSMHRGNYKEDIGFDLSLNSYMEVDKINTLVPNKKTTLNNDHCMKEGSCTGPSSAPDFSLSKDLEEDISGQIAYSTDIIRQKENSLSLCKKLELSLGCSNKKAAEPKRFSKVSSNNTDQQSEPVFEQRSYDDIPMEIVELMAKHQYERGLSEAERNSCLTKRIDERNYEMMGLSDVHGNGMQPLQKEHNKWNPVNLSQLDNNHCVVGNRDESHFLPVFGTCPQTQQKESVSAQRPQTSASRSFINNATQNLLWSDDRLVHRSSPPYTQVIDTYNKANSGPQHSGMAGNTWASGASSLVPPNPNFSQKKASGASNMATYLPYPDLHKRKAVQDRLVHRSSPAYTQVIDTYNTANNSPQHSGMAGNIWASGASSLVPPNPKFSQTIASGTSNMATNLPYTDLHKGKTFWDLDLNRADPNDSDVEVLRVCPVAANNTGRDLNLKEMDSLHSISNEAIPAMQLLSLMDAGTHSRAPFSINANKVLERPFFPCNKHPNIGINERANLFEKPLFPQNHQAKEYSGSGPSLYKSSASTTQIPSAYYGPNIVTSQQPEKAKKTYLPQQNKDWRVRTPVGTSSVPDIIRGCNLHQGKQKGILGASVDVVIPSQPNALKIAENQKDVGSCQMHGTIRPLRDISIEEVCSVNRNPADFTIPEAGNMYMIRGGDLKFSTDFQVSRIGGFDGQRRHGLKLAAPKRQAVGKGPTVFP